MRAVAVLVVAVVLGGCGAPAVQPTVPTTTTAQHVLTDHNRELLDKARQQGRRTVVLIISTDPARTKEAADAVTKLGVTVHATDPSVGYLRATAPVGEVGQVAGLPSVRKVDVDEELSNADPTP
jgi:hypothetical protein